MSQASDIFAVVPVKEFSGAKQRLAACMAPEQRQMLAATMLEGVLDVLAAVDGLAGIVVVSVDPRATALAERFGARVMTEDARAGQTAAVGAAVRALARERAGGMLTVPGDIPLISAEEVRAVLAAHAPPPAFTIVPAHDGRGSNAILCSPPDAVPLRFGDDSFAPHLAAARRQGIEPTVIKLPGIGMDIDRAADLARFLRMSSDRRSRTAALMEKTGLAEMISVRVLGNGLE